MEVFLGVLSTIIWIAIPIIVIYIQFKFSKSQNKYLGLILPFLAFFYSFTTIFIEGPAEEIVDGVVQSIETINNELGLVNILLILLVANIPTLVLLGIYVFERNKIKANKPIERNET